MHGTFHLYHEFKKNSKPIYSGDYDGAERRMTNLLCIKNAKESSSRMKLSKLFKEDVPLFCQECGETRVTYQDMYDSLGQLLFKNVLIKCLRCGNTWHFNRKVLFQLKHE